MLGADLRHRRIAELGCGAGHNVAHLAAHCGALVTGVDLVGLQIRRARSHYGRIPGVTFIAGHALHYLQATNHSFDAIYSVFGAFGLVTPDLLLPAVTDRLKPGGVLAFSVPHPRRGGRRPSADDRPRKDYVTLPDRTRLPVARWEFSTDRWTTHLYRAGLTVTAVHELPHDRNRQWPTTLLISARKD
ncbi:class I SAM-dependent methyltransferase [Streptomyces sp. NPDC020096]